MSGFGVSFHSMSWPAGAGPGLYKKIVVCTNGLEINSTPIGPQKDICSATRSQDTFPIKGKRQNKWRWFFSAMMVCVVFRCVSHLLQRKIPSGCHHSHQQLTLTNYTDQ